ncbi:MAG: pirin-like C-terminal cupin domain-containing protein, partial [Betaproteobacteria bacterium]
AAVGARELALLSEGPQVRLAAGAGGARCLVVAAAPLNEPVARYGPFVMNTRDEIVQAVHDYQAGRF